MLFTEHSMDVVFAYADRMIVLARGKLIAQGKGDAVRDYPKVREVYFGTGRTFAKRVPGVSETALLAVSAIERILRRGAYSVRPRSRGVVPAKS